MSCLKLIKTRLNQQRWVINAAVSIVITLYFCAYIHFRINQTFIHRAGKYDAHISHGRPIFHTNHFIEPGNVAEGPHVFAAVMMYAAPAEGTNDLTDADLDNMLASAVQHVEQLEKRRRRLFIIFAPAAFLETLVWKVIDPNPLVNRYR